MSYVSAVWALVDEYNTATLAQAFIGPKRPIQHCVIRYMHGSGARLIL